MGIQINGKRVLDIQYGPFKVKQVVTSEGVVWDRETVVSETVVITGTSFGKARDSFRAALSERGLDYRTVKRLPFDLDTSQVTTMGGMFQDCAALASVPELDTSQVTSMFRMFQGCSSLTTVPAMDTSKVTNMSSMFNGCTALTSATAMDTVQVTDMSSMFNGCTALTSVPQLDTKNVRLMDSMFQGCASLITATLYGWSGVGKPPSSMITGSGMTTLPVYQAATFTGPINTPLAAPMPAWCTRIQYCLIGRGGFGATASDTTPGNGGGAGNLLSGDMTRADLNAVSTITPDTCRLTTQNSRAFFLFSGDIGYGAEPGSSGTGTGGALSQGQPAFSKWGHIIPAAPGVAPGTPGNAPGGGGGGGLPGQAGMIGGHPHAWVRYIGPKYA